MSLVTSAPTNNLFYARPHLCPLPQGEDFGNHGLGDLIDCPANPGARIFKGTADGSPAPWGINCRWLAFSMTAASFTAQPFNSLFDDDWQHDKRGNWISPPPAEQCVECKAAQKNRRQITAE